MGRSEGKFTFFLGKKPKNFRKKGKIPPPIEYTSSGEDLCPVKSLSVYIHRTSSWRNKEKGDTKLFRSFISPHQAITTATISRWILTVLGNAGIDTSIFKAHSVRAASSSAARAKGASVETILGGGNWSQRSTWERFYHKPIFHKSVQDYLLWSRISWSPCCNCPTGTGPRGWPKGTTRGPRLSASSNLDRFCWWKIRRIFRARRVAPGDEKFRFSIRKIWKDLMVPITWSPRWSFSDLCNGRWLP